MHDTAPIVSSQAERLGLGAIAHNEFFVSFDLWQNRLPWAAALAAILVGGAHAPKQGA